MPLQFPESLPVSARREEIARAIAAHPVVIVSGETGSGKTTQLPKICLTAGRGAAGLIGHTQPRRLAATSVARRIAEEMGTPLGTDVGFKIRFNENVSASARIKLMTDGILLAESLSDPQLRQYDTLIIDEAHERSLNIDFLLGYLRQLLQGARRDDLKLIITSATLDAQRFAAHFASAAGPAPVIEVSGRTFPVTVRYRPPGAAGVVPAEAPDGPTPASADLQASAERRPRPPAAPGATVRAGAVGRSRTRPEDEDDETELPACIEEAIDELWREGPGDILVFLPGEREIRETADHLRRAWVRRGRGGGPASHAEILALYARLSASEQQKVFASGGPPRVVLATNVAETSLTVPGIRYVIDSGLARVKRYRYRGKVEQLQIEPISRAAANQRAGRCGRVAAGICIRLYDEQSFLARPAYTDPEILRSSLASVILRMKALKLQDIESFPFVDPPPRRAIGDGYELLTELDAIDAQGALTATGRQLARLPLDPRIARMLLEAHQRGCLREALIIAAALSVQDPRERPPDRQQAADQSHARFADPRSDFLSFVKLWDSWQQQQSQRPAGESRRALAARLERECLSPRKLREWADVHAQLTQAVGELGWRAAAPVAAPAQDEPQDASHGASQGARPDAAEAARYEPVHRSLLAGLLGNLGCRAPDEPYYLGTHATRFWLHPGSGLSRRSSAARAAPQAGADPQRAVQSASARWVMAAEMVDTGRLYARTVARIEPSWVEQAGAHLVRRTWSDPHWEKRAGQVMALERGVIYGLTLYAQRRVPYATIDPRLSRELLIREALVAGEWQTACAFHVHNRQVIAEVAQLEAKMRRPDLLVDEQFLFDWFDAQVPHDVVSGQQLERWWRKASKDRPDLLRLSRELLMRKQAEGVDHRNFPPTLSLRGVNFEASYHFEPGADDDGVTLTVPLYALNQVDAVRAEWLVPGMLTDKVTALLKSLPQKIRRHLLPLDAWAEGFVARLPDPVPARPLLTCLIESLREHAGVRVTEGDFRAETVPVHLSMNFRVIDPSGRYLAASRNLAQLRAQLGARAQGSFQAALTQAGLVPSAGAKPPEPPDAPVAALAPAVSGPQPIPTSPAAQGTVVRRSGQRFTSWDFGELPELLELHGLGPRGDQTLVGYPALVDREDSVELQVFDEPEAAAREHRAGLRRLFALALREPLKFFERNIPELQRLSMAYAAFGTTQELKRDLTAALLERACLIEPLPDSREAFELRVAQARPRVTLVGHEVARTLLAILTEQAAVNRKLAGAKAFSAAVADIGQQLSSLLPPNFLVQTDPARFGHLLRYLKAAGARLDKLRADPARDAQLMAQMAPLLHNGLRARAALKGRYDPGLEEFRWLLEELRVSLFAQELRTPMPVSVKRLQKIWESMR